MGIFIKALFSIVGETLGLSKNSLFVKKITKYQFVTSCSVNVSFISLSTSVTIVGLVYMIAMNIIRSSLLLL